VTRQCAWCWRVADSTGEYTIHVGHNLCTERDPNSITHGICEDCIQVQMCEFREKKEKLAA